MSRLPLHRLRLLLVLAVVAVVGAVVTVFVTRPGRGLPPPGSPVYEAYADDFLLGTAALDSASLQGVALEKLTAAIERIPQEPAAWANRGVARLRENQLEEAAADLQQAAALAPGNPSLAELLGLLAERRGTLVEAVAQVRRALAADPDNVRLLYRLAELLARQGGAEEAAERLAVFDHLVRVRPSSLFLLSERALLAGRLRRLPVLRDSLDRLAVLAPDWPADTRQRFHTLQAAARADVLPANTPLELAVFQNLLKREPSYPRDSNEISPRDSVAGTTLQNFLALSPLRGTPAPPDLDLRLVPDPAPGGNDAGDAGTPVVPVWHDGGGDPVLYAVRPTGVRALGREEPPLAFPAGTSAPSLDSLVPVDWDNDGRSDLVLAGGGGVRLLRNGDNGFTDVTAKAGLAGEVQGGDYHGGWAVDVDTDGDLDVVLARRAGPVVLLRNNLDGTFTSRPLFPGARAVRGFVWADLDNDGAPDAAVLDDAGTLHLFSNLRSGVFRRRAAPAEANGLVALAAADVTDDGTFDLVGLKAGGELWRFSVGGNTRDSVRLGAVTLSDQPKPGRVRLQAVDLDGNGAIDFVARTAAGGQALLADETGAFRPFPSRLPAGLSPVVHLNDRAALHVVGLAGGGWTPHRVEGTRGYHHFVLRARANRTGTGDNRVNTLAIGSEVEARANGLFVKQMIDAPVTVIGLGERPALPVLRLVWTNGAAQFEFGRASGATVTVEQRLKGSCPFLFSHDGTGMVFETDFCWSTPLGMYINAQAPGGFVETTDWVKVRHLKPRGGWYHLRVNACLWETIYLDQLTLQVIDHPAGTEVHVDERFFLTPTKPRYFLTGPSRPVRRAFDHRGAEVTDVVRDLDGRYLDCGGRGVYQGVTSDHWVEVDLSDIDRGPGPHYLLAHGWLHPTDSSVNFALEQGAHGRPRPLTLEVPDGSGGWRQAGPLLGFPAGKNKTMVIRLDGVAGPGVPPRLRLRTSMEIYWDALHLGRGRDAAVCRPQVLPPHAADLGFRGMLQIGQADRSSPEIPDPEKVISRGQPWRDLVGYHTRYGDVRGLLERADDRYVLLNAGDEIALRFAAPPPPPAGWRRSFVWVSDGWTKDGDLNTRFGGTVLPLPYHGMTEYRTAPGRLEDDPVARRFPADWQTYHTRFVAPVEFARGLRAGMAPRGGPSSWDASPSKR